MKLMNPAGFISFLILAIVIFAGCEYLPSTKANDALSQDKAVENLRYERDLQKLARGLSYITPSAEVSEWINKDSDREKYSDSAFLVSYRERIFLMTAGHVWIKADPSYSLWYIFVENKWINLPSKRERKISASADLAAIDLSNLKEILPSGAKLNLADDLVSGGSDLLVVCNPFHFPVTFIGRYGGKDKDLLSVRFTGAGIQPGCRGSPVVDVNGEVRGLVVLASANLLGMVKGDIGYAVPADKIAKFLDVMFFEK